MLSKNELNQLYRYALSLCAQEDLAYDLVQSAVGRYLNKQVTSLIPIEKPQAYLTTIIRNGYFDLQRHNKVLPMISLDSDEVSHIEPIGESSMEDLLINQQQVEQLTYELSSQENELLYLWAVEEHTVSEIAQMFEKSRGTILSKLHRLKKRMRAMFEVSDRSMNKSNLQ